MEPSLGLDFGTTNSVVALPDGPGTALLTFNHRDAPTTAFRSVLCFWEERAGARGPIGDEAGPWAIDRFLEDPGDCRFLQSLKTFAASRLFQETRIYGRRFGFEDLLCRFLELLRDHAEEVGEGLPRRFVVGRPVRFAGSNPHPGLALGRYRAALEAFGVEEVRFVYEPVAAAFHFARRLAGDAVILVADFGGGTSDFSVMRFETGGDGLRCEALASSGVGVAGDMFDYHIIDRVISPRLGKDSTYLSMGKELKLPNRIFGAFARWSELSVLKASADFRDLKGLVRASLEPERLRGFVDLVERDLGYALYQTVSEAKARLSEAETTELVFEAGEVDIRETLTRDDFEAWIADDLMRIEQAVDLALERAGLPASGIDRVFLTGGSSFVPAVRRLFERRFGASRIETGDEMVSIAQGLALIGARDDAELWSAAEDSDD